MDRTVLLALSLCVALVFGLVSGCAYERPDAAELGLARASYPVESIPGVEVSYLQAGDVAARRVIYVHGTPGSAYAWTRYLADPIEGVESVALDRPGFGESKPSRAFPSYTEQARAVEPLLVERDGRWPVLVGHSLGGPIVARVAADYPERVGGIVILAGSLAPTMQRIHLAQRIANLFPLCLLLPEPLRHANQELLGVLKDRHKLVADLGGITCPIVVIHGVDDQLVPFGHFEFMREAFAGKDDVEFIRLEGERHFIPWTNEGLVREAIERLTRAP